LHLRVWARGNPTLQEEVCFTRRRDEREAGGPVGRGFLYGIRHILETVRAEPVEARPYPSAATRKALRRAQEGPCQLRVRYVSDTYQAPTREEAPTREAQLNRCWRSLVTISAMRPWPRNARGSRYVIARPEKLSRRNPFVHQGRRALY
jgi:hypothetical protein